MKYFRINKMFFYKYWPDKWWTRRGNPTERQVVQSNCSDDSVWPKNSFTKAWVNLLYTLKSGFIESEKFLLSRKKNYFILQNYEKLKNNFFLEKKQIIND